ncbi:MAG: hypothetical protein WBX22_31675 [Silvibacterium sp.]
MRNFGTPMVFLALSLTTCAALGQASITIRIGKAEGPVTGLPFSADQNVRTFQQLGNGVTLTHEMKGRIFRSTNGRQRFECTLVATDPSLPNPTTMVWLLDPVLHTALSWNTNSKIAMLTHIPANASVTVRFLPEPRAPGGDQKLQPEDAMTTDLGHQTRDKLLLVGKRLTGTIPVGKIGNEEPIVITTETWVAPELKLVVSEIEQDPRSGNRIFALTNIHREEPDAALFEIPPGYTVKERSDLMPLARSAAAVSGAQEQQIVDARKNPDPALKNDVAYKLAMGKIDIPDAHLLAEDAVRIEEQQTTNLDLKGATAENFSQMATLSRYWNTLGWVYFREGNLPKAEAYTRAAWELDPQGYFGAHLGRIYEQQNHIQDAISIYRMALSARASGSEKEQIRSRLTDLGITDQQPLPVTVPVPLLSLAAHMSEADALFDILITRGKPPAVLFLTGSAALRESATAAIQAALQAGLPDNGPEKVLRRARVSCTGSGTPTCSLSLLTAQEAEAAVVSLSN